MSRIISLLNQKGGVGKTLMTVNLALSLVNKGYKVLCIDFDTQNSLGDTLAPEMGQDDDFRKVQDDNNRKVQDDVHRKVQDDNNIKVQDDDIKKVQKVQMLISY